MRKFEIVRASWLSEIHMVTKYDVDAASKYCGENNDCAIKAVALATDTSYLVIKRQMAQMGRKSGEATNFDRITKPLLEKMGYLVTDVTKIVREHAKTPRTFERIAPKGEVFLIQIDRHILCVKNGRVLDWTSGRRHHIRKVHVISKKPPS